MENTQACCEMFFSVKCDDCGNVFRSYLTCKKRTCPKCAAARSRRLVEAYFPVVSSFAWPAFLTLTHPVVWLGDMVKTKNKLIKSFAKLRRQKEWDGKKGIYTIEILKKEGDFCYVHLHAIVDLKWIDQKKLSEIWLKMTGNAFIVDIRRVTNTKKSCIELLKYQTKMWEWEEEYLELIEKAFKHSRFVGSFGIKRPEMKSHAQVCPLCGGKLSICEDWKSGRPVLREKTFYNDT